MNKKAEIIRVYLPPDANCLLSVADHCLRSRHYVNVIVAGKQPALDYLSMDDGDPPLHARHRHLGVGVERRGGDPDVVMACCGDVPTLETLAAVDLLRRELPDAEGPRRQRRRPDAAAARHRASARALRPRLRHALHRRPAGHLRLPRLPVADPPPHLPAHEPREHPRARLQGGGHDDDAVRHGHAQRPRPLPPRDGRDRPRARVSARTPRRCASGMEDERLRCRAYTRERRRGRARGARLDLAAP